MESAVISVTYLRAGTTFNVIPEEAEMRRIKEMTENYARALRCEASFELSTEYIPPTVNDKELAAFARNVLRNLGNRVELEPTMGAEDFSFYTKKAPGLYILLGIRNEEKDIVYPHHHPRFNVDEDVLWMGSAIHSLLAYRYLKEKGA